MALKSQQIFEWTYIQVKIFEAFINVLYRFVADRWVSENAIDGSYLFLPSTFNENENPTLKWLDKWDFAFFTKK